MDHGGADQPDPPGGGSGGSLFIGLGVLIGPSWRAMPAYEGLASNLP